MSQGSSYHHILRSSSIMGAAQAINYLAGLLRVKVVAVLLGPAGVGVVGLYTSATNLIGTVSGLGLQGSAVRTIAQAHGQGDAEAVARSIRVLRRLCWGTGALGWLASIALALPLSRWMFENDRHAGALAVLGGMTLLTLIGNGQLALLQGLRRIGDIARAQVLAAVLNTVATIALYAWLGARGIVPVLLVTAGLTLLSSWWFARRVQVPPVPLDWAQTRAIARPMLGLGLAMMWSGLLTMGLDLLTRSLLSRHFGLEAAGLYQAAWSLSGLFAGFVLSAMGTDFYPRLTAVLHDRARAIATINEQTEIGLLLALPGLLVTLGFAHWIVWLLYSAKFAPAADALAWMVLGVLGRVLSWPLGYLLLARGDARRYAATEMLFAGLQALLLWLWIPRQGVVGAAYAFAASYALYLLGVRWLGGRLLGFAWGGQVRTMMATAAGLVLATLAAERWLAGPAGLAAASATSLAGILWSLRVLAQRLGHGHRLVRWLQRLPGARAVLGV